MNLVVEHSLDDGSAADADASSLGARGGQRARAAEAQASVVASGASECAAGEQARDAATWVSARWPESPCSSGAGKRSGQRSERAQLCQRARGLQSEQRPASHHGTHLGRNDPFPPNAQIGVSLCFGSRAASFPLEETVFSIFPLIL